MGKTYVITGATSGIGKELVRLLAPENRVFAGYRNPKYLDELKKAGTIPFYIDMEKPETISDAAEFIKVESGKCKVESEKLNFTIINVAGCVVAGVMENLPVDNIRKQFEVNTFSHLDFTQRLLKVESGKLKVESSIKIINISSMASFGIFPFISPYCASKRALDILFNAFELESGIRVISVKPGVIATPLWDKSIEINKNAIENCQGHEKEMKYLVGNARRNGHRGLTADRVAEFIIKLDGLKNPKPSYTIGADAKMAELFSKLPFGIQNKIVKLGMKLRIK